MTKQEAISNIIYDSLNYMYCDNCRYNSEIGEDDPTWSCDDCHRKYNSWGVSRAISDELASKILKGSDNE